MPALRITLFRKLCIQYDGLILAGCRSQKALELFCYLLLHHELPHHRETLASKLWGDHCTTVQSKRYLSKALWQLQTELRKISEQFDDELLEVDQHWIRINPSFNLWMDVSAFENAYKDVQDIPPAELDVQSIALLKQAVTLYSGALLDGWFQDWCLSERERFQQIYLIILDKLMLYYASAKQFSLGIYYGEKSLQCDRARERTYRQLMRLQYGLGDRTGALRQYTRCVQALREELDIMPSGQTSRLYECIKTGDLSSMNQKAVSQDSSEDQKSNLLQRLEKISSLQDKLATMQSQIHSEIKFLESLIVSGD